MCYHEFNNGLLTAKRVGRQSTKMDYSIVLARALEDAATSLDRETGCWPMPDAIVRRAYEDACRLWERIGSKPAPRKLRGFWVETLPDPEQKGERPSDDPAKERVFGYDIAKARAVIDVVVKVVGKLPKGRKYDAHDNLLALDALALCSQRKAVKLLRQRDAVQVSRLGSKPRSTSGRDALLERRDRLYEKIADDPWIAQHMPVPTKRRPRRLARVLEAAA
jgi:hypothetical protein